MTRKSHSDMYRNNKNDEKVGRAMGKPWTFKLLWLKKRLVRVQMSIRWTHMNTKTNCAAKFPPNFPCFEDQLQSIFKLTKQTNKYFQSDFKHTNEREFDTQTDQVVRTALEVKMNLLIIFSLYLQTEHHRDPRHASVEVCNANPILEQNKFTISLSPPVRYRKLIMPISMSANKILNDS